MTLPAFTSNDRRAPATTNVIDCSFTKVGSGLIADEAVQVGSIGSGMTVAQSYGNLTIDTGTTVNSEVIWRSIAPVSGAHIARLKLIMSQAIANQFVNIALADLIGENLVCVTAADGLSMAITLPADHGFTSANIGQAVYLGGATGFTSYTPGRYVISAISGNVMTVSLTYACTWTRSTTTATVTFLGGNPIFTINEAATVSASSDITAIVNGAVTLLTQTSGGVTTFTCLNAGATSGTLNLTMSAKAWTASQTGTVCVYGWNCINMVKSGTSATAMWIDSQRKGWSSGASTVTTVTNASPGAIYQMYGDGQTETWADATPSTQGTAQIFTGRASRIESIPSVNTPLYLFVSIFNGVTAPASTTRFTVGHYRMLDIGVEKIQISGFEQTGAASNINAVVTATNLSSNVAQIGGQTVTTAGVNGVLAVGGNIAHSSAATANPAPVGGRTITTLDTTLTNNDTCYLMFTSAGQVITKDFGSAENDWQFASAAGGIVNTTTGVQVKAAGAASIRNYMTWLTISADALGAATEVIVYDGTTATVLFRHKIQTSGLANGICIRFPTPLKGSAATLMGVATTVASVTGGVQFSCGGYQSF